MMREDLRMDLDDLLVGHWSGLPFSYGAMEASELGFLSDGRGWSSWFNVGALCVTRFSWTCPGTGGCRAAYEVDGAGNAQRTGRLPYILFDGTS
jgi:hypothetical protein